MASFDRGSSQWGFTSYLLLILFGALVYSSGPLESDRPKHDSKGRQDLGIVGVAPGRLWEDPFESVLSRENELKQTQNKNEPSSSPESESCGGVFDYLCSKSFEGITDISVLGVMVNSGPYSEIVERRKRRRYAAISGLSRKGYYPAQTNFIKYIKLKPKAGSNIDIYSFIPFEWFSNKDNEHILVLWLQDEFFQTDYQASINSIKNIVTRKLRRNLKPEFRFIGPASSTLLKAIVRSSGEKDITDWLISPFATVPHQSLVLATRKPPEKLVRTITDDATLAEYLVEELQQRGLKVVESHVAFIYEMDTVFGRTMPRLFADKLNCEGGDYNKCEHLHAFQYLRGIDGITTKDPGAQQKKTSNGKSKTIDVQRQPIGSSQYDYLRRLARKMQDTNKKLHKEGKGEIRYIGVFGNDLYDKLLILQAVRPIFPKAVFFTTDLDARLLQDGEYQWTKNLIIASGYGFTLNTEKQGTVPPFRDSYQTSVFNSIQLALESDEEIKAVQNQEHKPLLFEVGRSRVVPLDLLHKDQHGADDHIKGERDVIFWGALVGVLFILVTARIALHFLLYRHNRKPIKKYLLIWWIIAASAAVIFNYLVISDDMLKEIHKENVVNNNVSAIIAIFSIFSAGIFAFYHVVVKHSRFWLTAWLVIVWAFFGVLTVLAYYQSYHGEPLSFTEGVSIWPTIYIRAIALVLCAYLLIETFSRLHRNYDDLSLEYFGIKYKSFDSRGSMKIFYLFAVLTVAVYMACMGLMKNYKVEVSILIWGILIGTYFFYTVNGQKIKQVNDWGDEHDNKKISITNLWHEYGDYGQNFDRMSRTLAIIMLYLGFACLIFTVLGTSNFPSRGGTLMMVIDKVVLVPAIFGLLFLLFTVVDEIRLCTTWINKFIDMEVVWDKKTQTKLETYDDAYIPYVPQWLNIHLIAARTNTVSKLVYFPFFVIVLMLLARSTYFDNWSFPTALFIIIGFNILIAVYGAIRLRQVAEKARDNAIRNLSHDLVVVRSESPGNNTDSNVTSEMKIKLIDELIQDIQHINTGAFRLLREQPFVRATIIVFGAAGLTVTEYWRLAG